MISLYTPLYTDTAIPILCFSNLRGLDKPVFIFEFYFRTCFLLPAPAYCYFLFRNVFPDYIPRAVWPRDSLTNGIKERWIISSQLFFKKFFYGNASKKANTLTVFLLCDRQIELLRELTHFTFLHLTYWK